MSKDSCILELASQLASLKAHDEIFKMEKIELENKLNLRISELEKEFIIDNMKNANVKLDKTDFDSMRNVFFNDQNENDNEEVKKLKKYIQYEEKKHNDHISELITLLSIETKQKDEYKAQLQEYENIRNMISNTPKEKDSFGCTNVTDITERSIPIESPSESSDQLTSFVKKEELEKLLLCSTSDFEEMKKNLLGLYSNNNSIPKTSRSTDFSARTEDTEISYSNSSFQMTAIVKINELEKQLFNSENAKSMLQDEIDEIIKKNYTASSVLENRAEEENLRNKINELEVAKSNKISELTSKFTIMENEFKNKIVNIDKEKTAKFDVLKNQLNQFSSSDEILKNQIAELEFSKEKKIGELEIELKTSKTKIETMKEEMSDMKSENVKLNSITNTKIAGLEIEILELEKDEKKYLQEINDLKTHQASCTEEFEIKEQKMIQEFSEIDKRKNSKIKEIEAEVVTLKIQINFCTNKIKDLETAATETLPSSEGEDKHFSMLTT